jgi:hypothetical protein
MDNVPRNTRYASEFTLSAAEGIHASRNALHEIRYTLYENRESSYLRAYKAPLHLSRILYKSTLFMQNKPNFQKSQMNVSIFSQRAYENKSNWTLGQNKPNSNPNKPNFRKAKMDVNLCLIEDYRKKDDFAVRKNKAKTNPIQTQ